MSVLPAAQGSLGPVKPTELAPRTDAPVRDRRGSPQEPEAGGRAHHRSRAIAVAALCCRTRPTRQDRTTYLYPLMVVWG